MNTNCSLIQPLFEGPLDIVGDVHGEIDALFSLFSYLGYNQEGVHPTGRRLVFVGDLTDRGPDSPAVCELIERLIKAGRAQCVLGNHDLNLLLGHRKHDNGWFYGEPFFEDGQIVQQVLADDLVRQQVLGLFRTLPVALERSDLKVIHAHWNQDMIAVARHSSDVVQLYHEHRHWIEDSFPDLNLDRADQELHHQNKNPVKLLTSGPEMRIDEEPIQSSGKIRFTKRVPWWNDHQGDFVVFGHYSIHEGHPRGGDSAFCIDYGVGKRWTERRAGKFNDFTLKLAALRWPEQVVVFDEASRQPLQ